MFVTIVAVLCHAVAGAPAAYVDRDCAANEIRIEEIVTDSSLDEDVTFQGCTISGQIGIAHWKSQHPIYHSDKWRVARIKCAPGHYVIKGSA